MKANVRDWLYSLNTKDVSAKLTCYPRAMDIGLPQTYESSPYGSASLSDISQMVIFICPLT